MVVLVFLVVVFVVGMVVCVVLNDDMFFGDD